ncbi:bacillithiol system redox-active protein YtxJ [Aestuariibaculum sediminum]|uniref:Bacillithiol system redox-active protein YtxJ n=1 Tax=Aestuariibaculum sediminum TaxID=2770637 RepID=A0A8J6Q017_9FLAO|nr:bacillithiol system redox-active protein YtxJ [Aestuariibaculum sediminum]MBD0832763.1 bacillithiol system redox-active protein YtxJ [Aestuariibaculum sediminum]
MGIFNKLFNGSSNENEDLNLKWIELNEKKQLENIKTKSTSKPQIIFKHSTRCGISRMVKRQFETQYNLNEQEADLYVLDLLNYRDISNLIAENFNVFHESPQLIAVKNGEVVKHASHGQILDLELSKLV